MAEKDYMEKKLEDYPDVFADIANAYFYQGKSVIGETELEQGTTKSVYKADGKLREQERDTVKHWRNSDLRLASFGYENQSAVDADETLRVIGYDGAMYRGQLYYELDENGKRRRNENPRYPVVTVVLYFGLKHWNQPRNLKERLVIPEGLDRFVSDYHINVMEVAWLTDEEIERFHGDFKVVADYFSQVRGTENMCRQSSSSDMWKRCWSCWQ